MTRELSSDAQADVQHFMDGLEKRNPGEPEFHQAVREVAETLIPFTASTPNIKRLRFSSA